MAFHLNVISVFLSVQPCQRQAVDDMQRAWLNLLKQTLAYHPQCIARRACSTDKVFLCFLIFFSTQDYTGEPCCPGKVSIISGSDRGQTGLTQALPKVLPKPYPRSYPSPTQGLPKVYPRYSQGVAKSKQLL